VDIAACLEYNIPIMGNNQSYSDVGIFEFCGPLVVKMLFMAGLEVKGNRVAVVSQDKFGEVITEYLQSCQANVLRIINKESSNSKITSRMDAIIVAQYQSKETIIGPGGWIEPHQLAIEHPECTVIQLCGKVDTESLAIYNIRYVPERSIGIHRMAYTLAHLGPKPVIDLHAAGLKVGELMWKEFQRVKDHQTVTKNLCYPGSICQALTNLNKL